MRPGAVLRLALCLGLGSALGPSAGCSEPTRTDSATNTATEPATKSPTASLGGGEVEIGEILRSGSKRYSQGDEELVIRDFFRDRKGGVFLDVGSWLPKQNSTTYYLERHLDWSGVAVDALAEMAAGYAEHRPRTRFYAYIVTDRSGETRDFYSAGALSSTDPEHHKGFDLGVGEGRVRVAQVETITLDDLLERAGVSKLDFLSMDIEGGEPVALAGFDIERFRPELVCIEKGTGEHAARLDAYFDAHGYAEIPAYREFERVNAYYAPR